LKKVACFLEPQKCGSTHHVYHAFHHNDTTFLPSPTPRKSQNPQQKRFSRRTEFFLQKP
jgi:hypothetical protein